MTIILWIVQAILAIKLITVTYSHGLGQGQETMHQAMEKMGTRARAWHGLIAIFAFIATAGLILPGLLKLQPTLTIWAAGLTVLLMLGSIFFHVKFREEPNVFVSVILLAMAFFTAYGRWALAPF
jgi:hypothetical protein